MRIKASTKVTTPKLTPIYPENMVAYMLGVVAKAGMDRAEYCIAKGIDPFTILDMEKQRLPNPTPEVAEAFGLVSATQYLGALPVWTVWCSEGD